MRRYCEHERSRASAQAARYRRRDALTATLSFNLTATMRAEVEDEAIADGVSAADIIRQCITAELPRMRRRRAGRVGRGA